MVIWEDLGQIYCLHGKLWWWGEDDAGEHKMTKNIDKENKSKPLSWTSHTNMLSKYLNS